MSKAGYLQRYLFIIRCVRTHPYCSLTDILAHIEIQIEFHDLPQIACSEKTIRRDIKDITNFFGLSIEYSRANNGYFMSDEEPENSFIEQTLDSFSVLSAIGGDTGKPDFIFPEKRKPSSGNEHFLSLKRAIEKQFIIEFDYHKFFPDEIGMRKVQPHALMQSRNRWYLLGFESQSPSLSKSFALDRIKNLSILKEKFTKDSSIDWQAKYENCFAMFTSNENPQKVVFTLDKRDGQYVETMPIHHSQKLSPIGERICVELNIEITLDFIMELMSRTWSIEVIEPISLKTELYKIYSKAAGRNQI